MKENLWSSLKSTTASHHFSLFVKICIIPFIVP